MIITKTPFRMSFFGGGTDVESYFRENRGAVLATSFDKYCYVSVRHLPPFFSYKNELCYYKTEQAKSVQDIEHPAIRNAMLQLGVQDIHLSYETDLPARSGLGTSSSFAVGMLNAFHALKGEYADKRTLAREAIHLERDLCGEAGGWQDPIDASFGGLNRVDFNADGFAVSPIIISADRKQYLNDSLMMFFTGYTRFSSDVMKAGALGTGKNKGDTLKEMYELVNEAEQVLTSPNRDLDEFGRLLDHTWQLKRKAGNVPAPGSTDAKIDEMYAAGLAAGALGGKLLGAGGGGFLVFYVRPEQQPSVRAALKDLTYIPFRFENHGTRVIYYAPEEEILLP